MSGTRRLVFGINVLVTSLLAVTGCARSSVSSSPQRGIVGTAGYHAATSTTNEPQRVKPAASTTAIRGIVEGFYGSPWTTQERIDMFQFMKQENLNTYIYAPKNDPYQRVDWRKPYPTQKLSQMKTLVTHAAADHVRFVYSISPGMTGTSTSAVNASITYSSESDRRALEAKIDELRSIGVHTFMLSFDDIETGLKPADKAVYGTNYAKAQMVLANRVLSDERQKDPGFVLWLAPTSYYGLTDGPYWQTLRSTLSSGIQVIWTGKWVLNKTITTTQAETITSLLGRKPIIWDNYPVNDYTYNPHKEHQLMMGPLQGRDATLVSHIAGYVSNPMLQPDASKLALATIADYLENPGGYKPMTAWTESIKQFPGITNPTLFRKFAEYNSSSILNPLGVAPSESMIQAYYAASSSSAKKSVEQQLETEFRTLANLPKTLPPTITDQELLREIEPWLNQLGEEGQGGLDALDFLHDPSERNKQVLDHQLQLAAGSPYQLSGNIIAFMQRADRQ